jgi:hypothetical protein
MVNGVGAGVSDQEGHSGHLVEEFIKGLAPHERVLIELKEKLYEGSWEKVMGDLRARLENRPYIFKLSQKIGRDLEAIEKMKEFEGRMGVDLAVLMKLKRV